MFAKADDADLLEAWGEELGSYDGQDVKRALEAMRFAYPDFPPTLYQFANLCREAMRARTQTVQRVEYKRYGQPSPEVLAAIHELVKPERKPHPHDWARKIVKRDLDGEQVNAYALGCAKEVLGIVPEVA